MARARRLGLKELQSEVDLLGQGYPKLSDDDHFVVWFVFAFVSGDKDEAAKSLSGKSGEKGIDAIYLDSDSRLVTIVQCKYRKSVMAAAESSDIVSGFAELAVVLASPKGDFDKFVATMEGGARQMLEKARDRVLHRGWRLNLHFATLGRASDTVINDAKRKVRSVDTPARQRPRLTFLNGKAIIGILADYLDGVAPPVPSLELAVQGRPEEQYDSQSGIASWIFSMNGNDVGELYRQSGIKLFARNIRGFLGETTINKEMRQTLRHEPKRFWYLNNGVTVVCDHAEFESSGGRERLTLSNPQIINGQQTTRVLASVPRDAAKASVSVRVISVARGTHDKDFASYEDMVARIVKATNSQNRIRPSDLRSNDRLQVTLERELQKLGYHYQRKRAAPEELAALGMQYEWRIKKEQLALAVTGCNSATRGRTLGREPLFEDPYYKQIFGDSPKYLLTCFWMSKLVDWIARGSTERQWAKYVVLHFMWEDLRVDISSHQDDFIETFERWWSDDRYRELERSAKHCFNAALQFYRANRGRGREQIEVSPFFKRQDVYERFERFWRSKKNSHRTRYNNAVKDFRKKLADSR